MNLIPILSEQEYNAKRDAQLPEYASVTQGHRAPDQQTQQAVDHLFDQGLKDYLEQDRSQHEAEKNRRAQRQVFYDKKVAASNRFCRRPWQTLGVNCYGDVFICISPAWIPKFVGNILKATDIFNVLNSAAAQSIRNEIINNRYYYCNLDLCTHARYDLEPGTWSARPQDIQDMEPLVDIEQPQDVMVTEIPGNIIFDFDHTCNYQCPSCRTQLINNNKHPVIARFNDRIVDSIKTLIIDKIGTQPVEIRWAGGEPFISKPYLELMDYIHQRHAGSNIQHCIQTNGSYLKSRADLLDKLLPHVKEMRISFDAATEHTYQQVRVNGVWDNLLENVTWLMQQIKKRGLSTRVAADFVVQKQNYQEILAFRELCHDLGIRTINYQRMWNWGTWPKEVFDDMNVYHADHPAYQEVVDILKEAERP